MDLNINNVINISVAPQGQGLVEYNTSNLAIISSEVPAVSFGADLYRVYLEPSTVAIDFGTSSKTYKMALAIFSQQPNILASGGSLVIIPMLLDGFFLPTETVGAAITRTAGLVQYFGVLSTDVVPLEAALLANAATVQAMKKILFVASATSADVEVAGKLDKLRSGGLNHTRGLFYGGSSEQAVLFAAAYAGRALSVNFSGSNTTATMHLKDLATIQPDPSMTQTLLGKCKTAGVDAYISIQGISKTFCSGANEFFDDVYNILWFSGALEVAGFNLLAQTSSKLPQTEQGVDLLKSAYRAVCEQAIVNLFLSAGKWNSPVTFGNQLDLYDNISQRGYYIYSQPVAQQSASDRAERKAPLIQIAIKYAGAIHSSTVIVNVNK